MAIALSHSFGRTHCSISILHGKTHIWNHGVEHPVGCESLTRETLIVDPNFVVWREDTQLAPQHRGDDVQKRPDRALKLVQMGELSVGRLALDGAQVADRNQATLKALTDTRRRPPVPRAPLSQFVAAADPSGMTTDHLQPVLDNARDTSLFFQFATVLAGSS